MSLYDDIILNDKTGEGGGEGSGSPLTQLAWRNSGIKLLQDHLQLKKRQESRRPQPPVKKPLTVPAATGSPAISAPADPVPPLSHLQTTQGRNELLGGSWDAALEYDPAWPNEYDKVIKAKAERKERERQEAKEKERLQNQSMSMSLGRSLVDDYSDEEDDHRTPSRPQGAAIAPPPSLMESSESVAEIANQANVSVVAAKMMTRMGYKEGQGLGRDEQGIARALEVEKIGRVGGKIVIAGSSAAQPAATSSSSSPPPPDQSFVAPMAPPVAMTRSEQVAPVAGQNSPGGPETCAGSESITEMMKNPTKVVLLRNMVGPGEVDEDLEPEVKEECSTKYGEVVSVVIYELPVQEVPPEEAVRIFVEFKRVESAIKALVDLNGRFFGGRQVKAIFFDYQRFKSADLKDPIGS